MRPKEEMGGRGVIGCSRRMWKKRKIGPKARSRDIQRKYGSVGWIIEVGAGGGA